MSKVTPTARQFVVAFGTAGLAVVGAVAGAVSAHAADGPSGLPLSTNAVGALKGLMDHTHGSVAGIPMKDLPVVGELPFLLDAVPADKLPGLDGLDMGPAADAFSPMMRSRPHGAPPVAVPASAGAPRVLAAPAVPLPQVAPAPALAPVAARPSAAKAASPLDGVTGFTDMLPVKLPLGGLEKGLPLAGQLAGQKGGLPVLDGLGGGDLLGSLPLDSLAG